MGLPNRRGHGGTDKASFSLILCLGRAANKATSNLHTTRRLISDSQGGPVGPRIKGGIESSPLERKKGLTSETSFTPAVLLALQIQRTDYDNFIYLFIFLAKTRDNSPLSAGVNSRMEGSTKQVRSYLTAYSK